MEQLEQVLKSSPDTILESCRTSNMVIQKSFNGFEAVNYFRKNLQTSVILISKILYSKLV